MRKLIPICLILLVTNTKAQVLKFNYNICKPFVKNNVATNIDKYYVENVNTFPYYYTDMNFKFEYIQQFKKLNISTLLGYDRYGLFFYAHKFDKSGTLVRQFKMSDINLGLNIGKYFKTKMGVIVFPQIGLSYSNAIKKDVGFNETKYTFQPSYNFSTSDNAESYNLHRLKSFSQNLCYSINTSIIFPFKNNKNTISINIGGQSFFNHNIHYDWNWQNKTFYSTKIIRRYLNIGVSLNFWLKKIDKPITHR